MKSVLSVFVFFSSMGLFIAPQPVLAAEVVDTYVKGSYKYTCIMKGEAKYCGNWNVVSG